MKLLLGLIHNNDKSRLKRIRPSLKALKENLPAGFKAEIIEIWKQPDITPHKSWLSLRIKCFYWNINRQWQKYKLLKPRNILLDILVLAHRLALTFINRKSENKRNAVYAVLTDKHIRAWNYFLDSDFDLLICFEDDAVFKENSITVLKKFLKEIQQKKQPVYLDLGGGNPPQVNKIYKLESKTDKLHTYYKKPVTNTACSYLINKKAVMIFLENLNSRPWLRLLGADWLMNKLFILTTDKYKYFCFHANPSVFKHGSLDGTYDSSI